MTEDRAAEFAGSQPFADLIGMEVTSVTADRVVAHLEWAPERCTSGGMLHGGAVMSLADAAGGLAAFAGVGSPPPPAHCTWVAPPSWSRPTCGTTTTGSSPG
jgi:acyl-coenzyme A thioesterase PaaI-like protein